MTTAVALQLERVSKKYCKTLKRSMLYGLSDIGRNMLGLSSHSDRLRPYEFWAVQDVSIDLKQGEILGIIGPNGSGKTTLLKMINGIFWPDKGKITVRGRVGALIQVGAGFHPLLTGRENIYVNAAILGMTKREVDKKFDAIVEFADIGDFLDSPVKHYSSGMFVRLGFAVAVHCDPELLLIDEILAVGDYTFQQKAFSRIEAYRKQGIAIVLVSHNLHTIRFLCSKVMVLKEGKTLYLGEPNQAVQMYQSATSRTLSLKEEFGLNKGSNIVNVTNVETFDLSWTQRNIFHSSEGMFIKVNYFAQSQIENPIIQFGIVRDDGLPCYVGNTAMKGLQIDVIQGGGFFTVKLPQLYVNSGTYAVAIIFFNQTMSAPYGADLMGKFVVTSDYPRTGKSCPAFSVEYEWIEIS